jgi:hypothetical protein
MVAVYVIRQTDYDRAPGGLLMAAAATSFLVILTRR